MEPLDYLVIAPHPDDAELGVAPDWPALRPSGAFLSTALDLARWDAMLYTNKVLSENSRRLMWEPVRSDRRDDASLRLWLELLRSTAIGRCSTADRCPGFAPASRDTSTIG